LRFLEPDKRLENLKNSEGTISNQVINEKQKTKSELTWRPQPALGLSPASAYVSCPASEVEATRHSPIAFWLFAADHDAIDRIDRSAINGG
jgi:hypothetical protein